MYEVNFYSFSMSIGTETSIIVFTLLIEVGEKTIQKSTDQFSLISGIVDILDMKSSVQPIQPKSVLCIYNLCTLEFQCLQMPYTLFKLCNEL